MRTHRIAIVINPDTLKKLDEISEKKGVKRAAYTSDIIEKFVTMLPFYGKVMDKDMNILTADDLVSDRIKELELHINDDEIITELEYNAGRGVLSGRTEIQFDPYEPWYKRLFGFFRSGG